VKFDASRVGADAVRPGLPVTLAFADGREVAFAVAGVRIHKGRPLVRFPGIGDATAAEALVGAQVWIAREEAPLGDGEYFDDDLIGCTLVDSNGVARGEVVDVAHYPAQDMLVIGAARAFVPLVNAFVRRIDVATKTIHVDVPPGLLDPADAVDA
jgi:16S rRNA processing protein RimM